jgi:hypothetical protein
MAVILLVTPLFGILVASTDPLISVGIVVGIVVFVASFLSTQIALYVLVFATLLSPEFGQRSTAGGGVTLRLDDFLLLLIGFSQLTKAAVNREIGLFTYTPLNRYITYYMLACVFATGLGMVAGRVRPMTGFFFVLKYFEYFIVYFMVANNLTEVKHARRFIYAMFATAAIVSFVAIAQIPGGGRVVAPFEGEQGEPNTLGGYLILIESIIGGILLARGGDWSFWKKIGLLGIFGLTFIPLLFTLSRAAWLSAVPVFVLLGALSDRKLLLCMLAVGIMVIAPYVTPDAVTERVLYTVEKQESKWARSQQEQIGGITFDTSSSERIRSWIEAIEDMTIHPMLGYGVTGWKFIDAQYLRVLLETGVIGLSTFMLLLWQCLKLSWRGSKTLNDPMLRGVSTGFFVGTIGMMTHATMANTFIIVRIMEPYWILAAIVVVAPALEQSAAEADNEDADTSDESLPPSAGRQLAQTV